MNDTATLAQRKVAAARRPRAAAFWRERLSGTGAVAFPGDVGACPGAPGQERAAQIPVVLPGPVAVRLAEISRGRGEALRLLVVGALAVVLSERTASADVVVGAGDATSARVLPLCFGVDRDGCWRDLVLRIRADLGAAGEHADFPWELFADPPRVSVVPEVFPREGTVGDLFLCALVEGRARVVLRPDPGVHTPAGARFLAAHVAAALTAVAEDPAGPIAGLSLFTQLDRDLVRQVNDTGAPYPDRTAFPSLVESALQSPDGSASLLGEDFRWPVQELREKVRRLAAVLSDRGVGPGDVVAVRARRSPAMLTGVLATMWAGAAYLPVDPELPAARIAYLLQDAAVRTVLTAGEDLRLLSGLPQGCEVVELDLLGNPLLGNPRRCPAARPDRRTVLPPGPRDAAYVIYTSGSTGAPKGVVVEHRSLINRLHWMQSAYPLGPHDVVLQKTTISFDVSVWELLWWLMAGASLALLEPGGEKEPAAVVAAIERHRVTVLHFVPTMLGAFLEYVEATGCGERLFPVRRIFCSGEALPAEHVRRAAALLPGADLINLYGPTEATVDVSHDRTDPGADVVTIGRPIHNLRLHVLGEQDRPQPVGVPGELCLAGDGLAREYLGRPELTGERFRPAAGADETRVYRTGDLVRRLPDGRLQYLGRNDFQVKVRGFRIELGEIEAALSGHPRVREAVVIARTGTDGQQHLYGYVVTPAGEPVPDLLEQVAQELPAHMLPERVLALNSFPIGPNGKLDRAALPDPVLPENEYVAPRTEGEKILSALWADVLGLERVGIGDNFFSLGGNSIHFVSVLARARSQGLDFTFQQLFSHPTVAELLALGDVSDEEDSRPQEVEPFALLSAQDRARVPEGVEDGYPLSMLQAGLVFESELMHGNTGYHDIVSYLIRAELDESAFRRAVGLLVEQNPIFRTSYHLEGFDAYVQLVHETVEELPLEIQDLRHLIGEEAQEEWYAAWFVREQNRPFSWGRAGLVRLHVHRLADGLFRYGISQHNSALDGWSMNQVHVMLFGIYHDLRAGREPSITAPPDHLRNFIGLERRAIASRAQAEFWRRTLSERPSTRIPRTRATRTAAALEVSFHDVPLPAGLSDRVKDLARTLRVPVKDVLLATHLKALSVLTGDDDVLTGYEHAGRPELPGAERALGVFLNTMPMRMRLAPGSWADLIRQTYATEAQALPHRRYPMATVKQDLGTTDLLFETVFNFTHFHSLKELKKLPAFALLDVRAAAITEFPLRAEFSQHFFTDEIQLSLHYHTRVFDEDHLVAIGELFLRTLEAMVTGPWSSHDRAALSSPALSSALAEALAEAEAETLAEAETPAGPGPEEEPTVAAAPGSEGAAGKRSARRVARLWGEVLGRDPASFGPHDDFFDVGGSSLTALRVGLRLAGQVSLRQIMQSSRLGELAELLDAAPPG
ncbi:MAG: hypothetical protein QG608_2419, partial [Actinomycetota bacterium]|nr:hypothetical protein [Actinomycetota bacterium]